MKPKAPKPKAAKPKAAQKAVTATASDEEEVSEEEEESEEEEAADVLPDEYNAERIVRAKGKGKARRYLYAATRLELTSPSKSTDL